MTSVSIKLTAEQQESVRVQIQRSRTATDASFSAIVKLTAEQFREVKKHFPDLESRDLTIQYSTTAAPFVPGGAVVTAAISSRAGLVSALGSASNA